MGRLLEGKWGERGKKSRECKVSTQKLLKGFTGTHTKFQTLPKFKERSVLKAEGNKNWWMLILNDGGWRGETEETLLREPLKVESGGY